MSETAKGDGLLAHSAANSGPKAGRPQLYADHTSEVARRSGEFADEVDRYSPLQPPLKPSAIAAGFRHDLGKLDSANQAELCKTGGRKQALPVDHVDAAIASLWADGSQWAALVSAAHHRPGLASLERIEEWTRVGKRRVLDAEQTLDLLRAWRLEELGIDALSDRRRITDQSDADRPAFEAMHAAACGEPIAAPVSLEPISPRRKKPYNGLPTRLLLSCLVDADHSDTAAHSTGWTRPDPPAPRWAERIGALTSYLDGRRADAIADDVPIDRIDARGAFFEQCLAAAESDIPIAACEGPVGIGKTTAVVAYLMRSAERAGLRRLFVVAPYTAIIDQTVRTLREALTLDGERPEEIVAAHHSRVEFDDDRHRHLAQLWTAPIIVTTAVQFFETLAASTPASLRKLHALPGSGIMLDESHAALPAKLWPLAWEWLDRLTRDWGCRLVLASGTLVRLWQLDSFPCRQRDAATSDVKPQDDAGSDIPTIARPATTEAKQDEARRVRILDAESVLSPDDLVERVLAAPGPRLVILNTTQSAAAFASRLAEQTGQTEADAGVDLPAAVGDIRDEAAFKRWASGRKQDARPWRSCVLHLSTLLCPDDRLRMLAAVRARLRMLAESRVRPGEDDARNDDVDRSGDGRSGDGRSDDDWTLVATSCIEAGVDVSFQSGFREAWSVASLLQTAGRISRGGEFEDATLLSFTLRPDAPFNTHPMAEQSATVLGHLFEEGSLSQPFDPTCVATEALRRELNRTVTAAQMESLLRAERVGDFPGVAAGFRVIPDATEPVLVDAGVIKALRNRGEVGWAQITRGSVGLTSTLIDALGIERDPACRDLLVCDHYDRNLLGLGRAVLDHRNSVGLDELIV